MDRPRLRVLPIVYVEPLPGVASKSAAFGKVVAITASNFSEFRVIRVDSSSDNSMRAVATWMRESRVDKLIHLRNDTYLTKRAPNLPHHCDAAVLIDGQDVQPYPAIFTLPVLESFLQFERDLKAKTYLFQPKIHGPYVGHKSTWTLFVAATSAYGPYWQDIPVSLLPSNSTWVFCDSNDLKFGVASSRLSHSNRT